MFCPNCGIHQTDGRKLCTSCGMNLSIVSQALSGKVPMHDAQGPRTLERREPSPVSQRSAEKQRAALERGVRLTLVGSIFLAIQFFSFLLKLPFQDSGTPFGFFSFVALLVMAAGISKLVSARPLVVSAPVPSEAGAGNRVSAAPSYMPQERAYERQLPFEPSMLESPTPTTSSLSLSDPVPSVIEAETEHLPEYVPRTEEKGS